MRTRFVHTLGLTLTLWIGCVVPRAGAETTDAVTASPTNATALAGKELTTARQLFITEPTNSVAAWQLGRACFTWGKLLKDPGAQEKIYTEGVTACRHSIALDPKSAPGHYYLGMNVGRVADLKRNLAAFSMVKEVEKSFQRARELDEKFAHAGPDRNLGLLYQHAPGWPLSVGDQKLARKHLSRAVELAGDYPENRLNLAEAHLAWKESKLLPGELAAMEKLWPVAKTNFVGTEWEADWLDWEKRLKDLQRKTTTK
jgi:tetratricopeptide (TPR) repeat protein